MNKNFMNDLEHYIYSNPKFNSRIPFYNDDSDYTTNAPSYYDDLARKNKLMKTLALRIWEYEEEMIRRLEQWDKNLEEFPDDVKQLLEKWLEDGTLDHIINDTIFSWKLDTKDFDDFIKNNYGDQTLLGTASQTLLKSVTDNVLNALDFGVKGDGVTDDTMTIQEFITFCEDNDKEAFFPSGTYLVLGTVRTRAFFSYHYTPGLKIRGAGKTTIFKGSGARAVNYNSRLDDQAIFNIFSSNNIITDIAFEECIAAFYFGKDITHHETNHGSFNIIERIWITFVGTGFLLEADEGIYYNKFRDIHIAHFQIGFDLMESTRTTTANNNRNLFEGIRLTRGWLGFSVIGDGNTFLACFGENITGNQATGNRPDKLPNVDVIRGIGGMYYFYFLKGSNNRIIGGSNENVGFDVYDEGYKNHYIGNRFDDFSSNPKVHFPNTTRSPGSFIGESNKLGFLETAANSNSPWGTSAGITIERGSIIDKGFQRQRYNIKLLNPYFEDLHSQSYSRFSRLGRVLKWTLNMRFGLTGDMTPETVIRLVLPLNDKIGVEELTYLSSVVTGNNMNISGVKTSSNATFRNSFDANAYFEVVDNVTYLVIHPPENGWREDVDTNTISFDLSIYTDNK